MTVSVHIIAIGKNKDAHITALIDDYARRMSPWRVTWVEIPAPNVADAERKKREAALILDALPKNAAIIALDERGKNHDSVTFAEKLGGFFAAGSNAIAFVIGGADGLDDTVRARADMVVSFGALTWPHMLVRVMLAEQLYRAMTILSGHPYHRQ